VVGRLLQRSALVIGLAAGIVVGATGAAQAAPLFDVPVVVVQPDGEQLHLLASGDEVYNWLHDAADFTVVQDPASGYYVYADLVDGVLVPSAHVVGRVDPSSVGLRPRLHISVAAMRSRADRLFPDRDRAVPSPPAGTVNNIVIFIRFAGEGQFTEPISTYTSMFNSTTAGANSVRNYFAEVSYGDLTVASSFYPTPTGTGVLSYRDGRVRAYYQPYNAVSNPKGYRNDTELRNREHALLAAAVAHVDGLGQFPSGNSLDADNDGYVDSIVFIVSGEPDGWSSLLWPHQWSLYSRTVMINGKRVDAYNFQLAEATDVGVLAHEFFHTLGAPDLYHYSDDGISPVGTWDLMDGGGSRSVPSHMSCYMKWRYGGWIDTIPEITTTGSYSLKPLRAATGNCFRIASPNSTTEYFVVEYRRRTGTFERSLPGSGMLVYRVNTEWDGWGNADGPPDELYLYRPGGTRTRNGSPARAFFSSAVLRTAIDDTTNPRAFLANGAAGGLDIDGIGLAGPTISFSVTIPGAPNVTPSDVTSESTAE
jgi:M6 family metalloprotease-like protein